MVWFAGVLLKPLLIHNKRTMNKVNTKTVRVKEYRDFSKGSTPQERYMENVERGYTTTDVVAEAAARYEVIEGKRYRVVTL